MNKTLLQRIIMCLGVVLFAFAITTDANAQKRGKRIKMVIYKS